MKNIDLEKLALSPMSEEDLRNVNGGSRASYEMGETFGRNLRGVGVIAGLVAFVLLF
jgi:hypothetical protein